MCRHCGAENSAAHRFCGQCGTPLAAPGGAAPSGPAASAAPPEEGERRQLTVMFVDLVGSTELATRIDPEDLRDIFRAYRETIVDAVEGFGGHVARWLGDGALVYFGYPRALDNAARTAVQAALAVISGVERLSLRLHEEGGPELQVRLGLDTGLVVIGDFGEGAAHERAGIVGESPNIAARLQSLADPNTAVISAATHRLVERYFVLEPLGDFELKGLARPVRAFRVLGEAAIRSPFEALGAHRLTPLLGREEELATLGYKWRRAQAGAGQAVLVSGEPGIGKTRLVRAFEEQLAGQSHLLLACHCLPHLTSSAFFPIVSLLHNEFRFGREDTPAERLTKIERLLALDEERAQERVPVVAALLQVPLQGRYAALDLSAEGHRQKAMEWLLHWLIERSEAAPLLFIVEDLHWADASTMDLIMLLIGQVPRSRMMLLMTSRPELSPRWTVRAGVTQLALERLAPDQVEVMVDQLSGAKPMPAHLRERVIAKTDGVPLFIEELMKMVLEAEEGTASSGPPEPGEGVRVLEEIPATIRDLLAARLDRLAAPKATAQLAATIGRDFSYEMLASVSTLEEATLHAELAELVAAELLYQHGMPPRASYSFKHSLIQEAAYRSLLRSRRRRYHERIARVLVERFPDIAEAQPESIAHHFATAGLAAEAIRFWRKAGQRDLARSANVEAADHLARALKQVPLLPATADRAKEEVDLQLSLGAALAATKGYGAAVVERCFARARDLVAEVGADSRLYPVLRGLQSFYQVRGPLGAAHQIGEQLLRTAQDGDDPAHVVEAKRALGWCRFCMGDMQIGRELLREALASYRVQHSAHHIRLYGADVGVLGYANLAWLEWFRGDFAAAVARSDDALLLARQISHPLSSAYALCMSAAVYQGLRDIGRTAELAQRTIALARENKFPYWTAWGTILEGWAIAAGGALDEGAARLKSGIEAYRATGAELFGPHALALLAELRGRKGELEQGLRLIEEAQVDAESGHIHFCDAELLRLKGELLLGRRFRKRARESLERALGVAREQGALALELRIALSLLRARPRSERGAALAELARIRDRFPPDADGADLRDAALRLAEPEPG